MVFAARVALGALVVWGAAGCSQLRQYPARSLPAELQAPPVQSVLNIDLSRFAGPPVAHDVIDCGDVLKVSLAAGLDASAVTNFSIRVGDDGAALLPEIGQLRLAGLYLMQAEQQIAAACVQRNLYRQPHVTVAMEQQRINRVTVVGAVKQTGVHELPRGASYLLAAIVAAGGLTEEAGTKVEIRQPAAAGHLATGDSPPPAAPGVQPASHTAAAADSDVRLVRIDLLEAMNRPGGSQYLPDGSVVTVERRQPDPLQVIGLVQKPGQYDFPVNHEIRLLGAIAMAGGPASRVADKVLVLRNGPDGKGPVRIDVSLVSAKNNAAENLRLAPGDVVSVEQTPATFVLDMINVLRFSVGANLPMF